MNKRNSINKRDLLYNEIIPYRKNYLRTEKDFNENFPKINSKYFSSKYNQSESKLPNNNYLITDRTHKNENKIQNKEKHSTLSKDRNNMRNKFFLNIKNIEMEDKKDNNNNNNYMTNFNNNFLTLNDININNILKKKKKNNLVLNIFKEKDSDMISSTKNLENNILEENSGNNNFTYLIKNKKILDINTNNNNSDKNIEINKFKNIGTNTKLSKTALNFHPQKDNKVIYSYQTKEINNKYNENRKKKYKFIYSRNENINNIRPIISSNENKTIDYKMKHNNSNKNNNSIKNKTNNNYKNRYKINNIFSKSLSNQIFRKVELSNQMNKKISDEYVQNLLSKEIDEIERIKKKRNDINSNKNVIVGLFHNSRIKNQITNMNTNNYGKNWNKSNSKNKQNNIDRKSIITNLKTVDLFTDIQMFDNNLQNEELIKLYKEYRKQLLNHKDIILELGQYFVSLFAPQNKKNKNIFNKKFQDKIIMTDIEEENNKENEKKIYNDEEKHIIKDIIYHLSNDLNENLELFKRNKNKNKTENAMNTNNITLTQLFERLNKVSRSKRKRFTKCRPSKIEDNFINNNNNENQINNSFYDNIYNNISEEENEENKKLLNEILFKYLEENKSDNIIKNLNGITNNLKDENDNLLYDELKQYLSNTKQSNKENIIIKNSNLINNDNPINIKKNENNKSVSKTKKKDIDKIKKKKSEKKINNKIQTFENVNINNNAEIKDIENELHINFDNNNSKKRKERSSKNNKYEEDMIQEIKDYDDIYEDNIDEDAKINKEKKSNISKKSKRNNKSIKEVKFTENISNININNNEYALNDSFINIQSPKRKNKQFHFSLMNSIDRSNEDDIDNYDQNEKYRKYSTRKMSIIESISKTRKKKFQKTRRDKTNRLINLKNDEYTKKEQKNTPVDIREEMLNRKLRNFFGKIKMLKNGNVNNYDEQLKMFIDNEIDKLNDWETKEQETRINNFFSDLKLIKQKVIIGGDIKYVSPSTFSSTFINFEKFK